MGIELLKIAFVIVGFAIFCKAEKMESLNKITIWSIVGSLFFIMGGFVTMGVVCIASTLILFAVIKAVERSRQKRQKTVITKISEGGIKDEKAA